MVGLAAVELGSGVGAIALAKTAEVYLQVQAAETALDVLQLGRKAVGVMRGTATVTDVGWCGADLAAPAYMPATAIRRGFLDLYLGGKAYQ